MIILTKKQRVINNVSFSYYKRFYPIDQISAVVITANKRNLPVHCKIKPNHHVLFGTCKNFRGSSTCLLYFPLIRNNLLNIAGTNIKGKYCIEEYAMHRLQK